MDLPGQSKPRTIITGGAGFIGSHIADQLVDEGYEVLVIDNYVTGRKENNKPSHNLTIVEGDIKDRNLIDKIFTDFNPGIVIHAAATYKDPADWEEDINTNILGTANIIRAIQRSAVTRLIYLQTSLSYGLKPVESPISLQHPLFSGRYAGGSSYAISKTTGELYIELSDIEFISFRLANTYGPRNLSGPLPAFYKKLTTGQKVLVTDTRRDFIYVNDLVDCIMKAVKGSGSRGYYHLGTGKDHSIKEIYKLAAASLGIDPEKEDIVEYQPKGADDVSTLLLDVSKTKLDFDWTARTSIEEGVNSSIAWYKQHGLQETYTHLKLFNKS